MSKKVTPLTDSKIKTSKSIEKDYTLPDGDGLHLLVKKIGSKLWEFVYISLTRAKRRKTSLGAYPDVIPSLIKHMDGIKHASKSTWQNQ